MTTHTERPVLLVEDDPHDEALTRRALTKTNLLNPVVVAHDGVEALDYLFRRGVYASRPEGEEPQLVLLDLKLPKLDGLEVLRALRTDPRTKHLPVCVLTTSAEEADVIKSYDLGANSFVQKPVDSDQFTETVRQLGLFWLLVNRNASEGSP